MRLKGGVGVRWGLVRLKFTRGTPSRQALRSAKPIWMCKLGYCPTLDTMLRVFELLVQNSDDVRLGLMRQNVRVGVRWGFDGREFGLSPYVNSGLLKSNLIAAVKPLIYCEAVPSVGYRRHVDPC